GGGPCRPGPSPGRTTEGPPPRCAPAPSPRAGSSPAGSTARPSSSWAHDASDEIPADRVLPHPAFAGQGAALRAVDGLRGEPRGPPVRLRVHAGVARRARRAAAQAPAAPGARGLSPARLSEGEGGDRADQRTANRPPGATR